MNFIAKKNLICRSTATIPDGKTKTHIMIAAPKPFLILPPEGISSLKPHFSYVQGLLVELLNFTLYCILVSVFLFLPFAVSVVVSSGVGAPQSRETWDGVGTPRSAPGSVLLSSRKC